jgi:hypothetical protein
MKSKKKTPMEELTKGYEKFINGKKVNKNGEKEFQRTLKKAATPKPRGSK